MKLPNNWALFKSLALEKIKTYCKLGIWPYDYDTFTAWLSNFDQPEDEYVALHLLDSLIVRSKQMAISGYARLLHSDLREYLISKKVVSADLTIGAWMRELKQGALKEDILFVPVRLRNDFGESGSTLYRLLSKHFRTDITSANINLTTHGKTIILIDDFIGGGTQFLTYADESGLSEVMKTSNVIYCPLIALEAGIQNLTNALPELKILPVEVIENSHCLFFGVRGDDKFRNDCDNSVDDIKKHLAAMQTRYAGKNMPFWFGKDDACLPLVFEWGCPNQSFSILWMEHTPKKQSWHQLFSRRS